MSDNDVIRLLSADEILSADDIERKLVYVPQWKGHVWVRALTLQEQDHIRNVSMSVPDVKVNGSKTTMPIKFNATRALTVRYGAIHEDGTPLFNQDQAKALGTKAASAVDTLFDAIVKLTSMTEEEVDELLGNSDAGETGDSSFD